jgi:hypothetical protein
MIKHLLRLLAVTIGMIIILVATTITFRLLLDLAAAFAPPTALIMVFISVVLVSLWLGIAFAVLLDYIFPENTSLNEQAPVIPTAIPTEEQDLVEDHDLVERGMPALKEEPELSEKISYLAACIITADTFQEPILASDLHIYDHTTASYKRLNLSAFDREQLLTEPFPFAYKKLKDLCDTLADDTKTIKDVNQNLLDLAICPVSGELMQHPEIAHLKFKESTDFMLVCDKTALHKLPKEFQIVRQREFGELRDVLIHQNIIQDTDYKTPNVLPSLADWKAAFQQCKDNFRSVHLPAATVVVGRNPHTMFHLSTNALTNDDHLSDEHNHTMGPA